MTLKVPIHPFLPYYVDTIEKPTKKLIRYSKECSTTNSLKIPIAYSQRKKTRNQTKIPIGNTNGNLIRNKEFYSAPTENEQDFNDKYITMDCYNTPDEYPVTKASTPCKYSGPFDFFLSTTNSYSSTNSSIFASANTIPSFTNSFSSTYIIMSCSNDDGYFSMEPSEMNVDKVNEFSISNETNFPSFEIKNMTESARKLYLVKLEKELEKYVCNDPFANYRIESY